MNIEFLTFRQMTYRLYASMLKPALLQYKMTQMEMDILLLLHNIPTCNTASQIIAARGLTKSQVSAAVEALVRKGYLDRQPDGKNLRRIYLSLTDAAAPVVACGQQVQRDVAAVLLRGLSLDEQATLGRLMHQVIENIRISTQDETPC